MDARLSEIFNRIYTTCFTCSCPKCHFMHVPYAQSLTTPSDYYSDSLHWQYFTIRVILTTLSFLSGSLLARIHLIRWISWVSRFEPRLLHIIMHCPTNWAMLTGQQHSLLNNLLNTHSFIDLNSCVSTFWKLNPYKVVGYILISSNKQVSARENVEKWVLLVTFLFTIYIIPIVCIDHIF